MSIITQRKSFTYRTSAEWKGRRAAQIASSGKDGFRVASPPEFRGEPNVWTPEDLFVSAIETCFLMTFAGLVEKRHLAVEAYYSEAEGLLEYTDEHYRFTLVTLKPTVIVRDVPAVAPVAAALDDAKNDCLIANSLTTRVIVVPDIEISVTS